MEEYNPNSTPALLATILARLDNQEQRHSEGPLARYGEAQYRLGSLQANIEQAQREANENDRRMDALERWQAQWVAKLQGFGFGLLGLAVFAMVLWRLLQ